jgi:hypothetical protein
MEPSRGTGKDHCSVSAARSKNQAALQTLGLAPELLDRLQGSRIGIYSDHSSVTAAGRLTAEALGEVLGRLWPNIDATGPLADITVGAAAEAAASGRFATNTRMAWEPTYDFVVAIGCLAPGDVGPTRRIGADGWTLSVGPQALVTENRNPVGPGAVAALVAADILKAILGANLGDRALRLPAEFRWSMFDYQDSLANPDPMALDLGDCALFGVGAVTHAFSWYVARWPAPISGKVDLVDRDTYAASNGQRYIGMRADFIGRAKVEHARALFGSHDGLELKPHKLDMNSYFAEVRPNCVLPLAIVGVDSAEHRRQLAMKLPRRVINIWTEGERVGASRYGFERGWACLYCAYPRDESGAPDEVSQIQSETNLAPVRIRELLNTSDALTDADAAVIAAHTGADLAQYLGQPLRSVRAHLCAIGRIPVRPNSPPVDVPLAFGSFLAGLGGFIELVKEACGDDSRRRWQFNSLRVPQSDNFWSMAPTAGCYLCGDDLTQMVVATKYA